MSNQCQKILSCGPVIHRQPDPIMDELFPSFFNEKNKLKQYFGKLLAATDKYKCFWQNVQTF